VAEAFGRRALGGPRGGGGAVPAGGASFATLGTPRAGWLPARRGRRPVTPLFPLGVLLAIVFFYWLAGPVAPPFWIALIFGVMGTQVTLAAYGAEMFPTGVRSTASGIREVCKTGGGVTGLALGAMLYGVAGSSWTAIGLLCG